MAKSRKTYMIEDDIDRKIEFTAVVEGKTKSKVLEEALEGHLGTKDFLKLLTNQRVRAAAAAAGVSTRSSRNHPSPR